MSEREMGIYLIVWIVYFATRKAEVDKKEEGLGIRSKASDRNLTCVQGKHSKREDLQK